MLYLIGRYVDVCKLFAEFSFLNSSLKRCFKNKKNTPCYISNSYLMPASIHSSVKCSLFYKTVQSICD